MKLDVFIALMIAIALFGCDTATSPPPPPGTPPKNMWQHIWPVQKWIETILPTGNGHVFVGTYDSALFHSTDNGVSFIPSSNGMLPREDVHALAVGVNGYLYAGTYGGAFYLSTDQGSTWSQPSPAYGTYFDLFPCPSGELFAALLGRGVSRTTDHGTTWTNYVLPDWNVQSVARTSGGSLFAGTNSGLYVSTDSGATWAHNTNGMPASYVHSIKFASNGFVFAGCATGVFYSSDYGASWSPTALHGDSLGVFRLGISPNDYIVATNYGRGIFISSDYGSTWTNDTTGMTDRRVRCVAITPDGYVFAGTYNSGVFRTSRPIY